MTQNMFLYRLKAEFLTNIRPLSIYLICLLFVIIENLYWWLGSESLEHPNSLIEMASALVASCTAFLGLIMVAQVFKRDDLKSPQDFSATRPIRALPFYGAKLVFLWLAIIFPLSASAATMGLVAGSGVAAITTSAKTSILIGFPCTLIALTCMSHAGKGPKTMKVAGYFIIGVLLTSILLSSPGYEAPWREHMFDYDLTGLNILIFLAGLTLAFTWMCIRQAHNKHLHYRPLSLAITGAISTLCIAFVPLTSLLPKEKTRIPSVTKAILHPDQKIILGHRGGIRFIMGEILSQPIEELNSLGIDHSSDDISLDITGVDTPWFELHYVGTNQAHDSSYQSMPTELKFHYIVHETEPEQFFSEMRGSSRALYDAVKDLPTRKIRIKGNITSTYYPYEELHRSPLTDVFSLSSEEKQVHYIPRSFIPGTASPRINSNRRDIIATKELLPILTGRSRAVYGDAFRHFITHPSLKQPMNIDELSGGRRGYTGLFKRSLISTYDFSAEGIEFSHMWRKLKEEQGYEGTPEEWRKEAILITEKAGDPMKVEIPLDIEIEIPDPELIRKMLNEGEFEVFFEGF